MCCLHQYNAANVCFLKEVMFTIRWWKPSRCTVVHHTAAGQHDLMFSHDHMTMCNDSHIVHARKLTQECHENLKCMCAYDNGIGILAVNLLTPRLIKACAAIARAERAVLFAGRANQLVLEGCSRVHLNNKNSRHSWVFAATPYQCL